MFCVDPMAIVGAFSGIKTILDIGKTLEDQKVVSAINSAVADVQVKLILTQQQIMEVQEENRVLKETIHQMEKRQEEETKVSHHDGAIWKRISDTQEDGPFCPSCWALEKKLVPPTVWDSSASLLGLTCVHHKQAIHFNVPGHLAKHLTGK